MNALKERRQAAGLTQQELADLAGVSQATISLVEVRGIVPRVDTAIALADALACEVGDLFEAAS